MRAWIRVAALVGLAASGCKREDRPHLLSGRDGGPAVVMVDQSGRALDREIEPNNVADTAQALSLPGGIQGAIDRVGDEDSYGFEIRRPGILVVSLSGVSDADLVLTLFDAAGKTVVRSDNGPAGTREGFPNLVVQPGRYRLHVSEYVKKAAPGAAAAARTVPSAPYALEVHTGPLPSEEEELEPNDQAAFSGELPIGGIKKGYAGWRRDEDYWRVSLASLGANEGLAVDLDAVPGVAWRVRLVDSTEKTLMQRQAAKDQPVAVRNLALPSGEPFIYLVVACGAGNIDEPYTIRASSAPFRLDEETEPNDSAAAANAISDEPDAVSGVRVGYLVSGDEDYYRVPSAPSPRSLRLKVEPPAFVNATLGVVSETGQPIVPVVDKARRGEAESLANVPVAASTTVFVVVSLKGSGSESERYRLEWSLVPDGAASTLASDDAE